MTFKQLRPFPRAGTALALLLGATPIIAQTESPAPGAAVTPGGGDDGTGGTVSTDRTMRPGDEGQDVRNLQEALVKKGYIVDTNGKYDSKTEDAVRQLQGKSGIPPDGALGRQTRQLLGL